MWSKATEFRDQSKGRKRTPLSVNIEPNLRERFRPPQCGAKSFVNYQFGDGARHRNRHHTTQEKLLSIFRWLRLSGNQVRSIAAIIRCLRATSRLILIYDDQRRRTWADLTPFVRVKWISYNRDNSSSVISSEDPAQQSFGQSPGPTPREQQNNTFISVTSARTIFRG